MFKRKISIYVRNKNLTPSSYYRVIQYVDDLNVDVKINELATDDEYLNSIKLDKNKKIYPIRVSLYYIKIVIRSLIFLIRDNINIPDCIIISKYMIPKHMPLIILILLKRLVSKSELFWDIDDYIFNAKKGFNKQDMLLGSYSKKIIVTNEFLKSKLLKEWQEKTILVCTTDGGLQGFQEEELIKKRINLFKNEIRLVWVATKSNISNIYDKIYILDKAAEIVITTLKKKMILTIVCDEDVNANVKFLKINNVKWNREVAKKIIYESHVGIMPLKYSEYSKGKGGFKLIQYISTGLPVIASAVGYNNEIINESSGYLIDDRYSDDGWIEAILKIVLDDETWIEYSRCAYKRWKEKFSYENNLKIWNWILTESDG